MQTHKIQNLQKNRTSPIGDTLKLSKGGDKNGPAILSNFSSSSKMFFITSGAAFAELWFFEMEAWREPLYGILNPSSKPDCSALADVLSG